MYRYQQGEIVKMGQPASLWMVIPLLVLTLFVVVLGFWPSLANPLTYPAAQSLLSAFGLY
jgi:hypothetical protein